jgi:hypothetical protein
MPETSFQAIGDTFKRVAGALRDGDVRFMLAGGFAAWARGGPITQNDLDVVVAPADADRALAVLGDAGMQTEKPPEEWLYKAWDGEVLVDLIFHPRGLDVDDALFERADSLPVLAVTVPVMGIEDVLVAKLLALDEQRDLDYGSLLAIARALREQIAWDDVRARTSASPYAKAFFTLVEELELLRAPVSSG